MSSSRSHRQTKFNASKSSVASTPSIGKSQRSSRWNRKSQSGKAAKQMSNEETNDTDQYRIFDEKGNDVTPRPINDFLRIQISYPREDEKSNGQTANKNLIDNLNRSVSEKSTIGTINMTTSTSQMVYTRSLLSIGDRGTLDIGMKIVADGEFLLAQTLNEDDSRSPHENDVFPAQFLLGVQSDENDQCSNEIILIETETMFILDLISDVVPEDHEEEYQFISKKNEAYIAQCQNRRGSDAYMERGMQTFDHLPKHSLVLTEPILLQSQEVSANAWDMYDAFLEANQSDSRIYRSYKPITYATEKQKTLTSQHETHTIASVSSKSSHGLFSEDSIAKMSPSESRCFALDDDSKAQLIEIDVDGFVMERILNLNVYYMKQLAYQGQQKLEDRDQTKMAKTSIVERNISLERLWHYTSDLTQGRNVSCLCLSDRNHNLLAVGYGKYQYNDDKEGLVCCWSTKNPEFPERYYQTDAGVTSLSFSLQRPNLLAVGLFNGNICVFDLNHNHTLPIVNTTTYEKRHRSPVWQLAWNERDRSAEIENIEVLISISSDGRVTQWILRKEFEATDLMQLKPCNFTETSCQTLQKNDGSFVDGHVSSVVGGFCFDIRPNDKTIYLCGTDEGLIHRCSTIYNEKYLESYRGHMSPVYKVHWSPFVENIFLSASADWTVRIWMIPYEQSSMVFLSSTSKAFVDAIWSPKSPTMFFCISENAIEIWDLYRSTSDPIYTALCADQLTLTSIAYATDSDCLLVGTNDGAVWIYHLENLWSPANEKDLMTIVQDQILSQCDSQEDNASPSNSD